MEMTEVRQIDNELWEQYGRTRDRGIRDKIIMAYLPIVKMNAKRMSPVYKNHADLEDIVNQGVLALIDCIDKYDWTRGVRFDSYASIRVRGSIIDYIRKQDWVPRGIRKQSIDIENAASSLQVELGRSPTDRELADKMGMTTREVNKIIGESQSFAVLSFEDFLYDNTASTVKDNSPLDAPEQRLQEQEIRQIIAGAIDSLSEKERTVISLYYFEELKLKEIAFVLGLTESRISQLHTKALMKLKSKIGSYLKD